MRLTPRSAGIMATAGAGALGLWLLAHSLAAGAQEAPYISLDEMEGDIAAGWRAGGGTATGTLEPDDRIVKEGESSGRWDTDTAAQAIYLAAPGFPANWELLGAFEMWVHSERPTGAVFAVVLPSENPGTDGEDYYRCLIPVDWEGWQLFHLEPRSFAVARAPIGWRKIDTLRFAIAGWNDLKQVPGTVLRFDALRLARSQSTPERRVLFEPDTDWCAWWPLRYATTPCKTGRHVSDWRPAEDGASVANASLPHDWSGSVFLNLWVYAESAGGATLAVTAVSDRPGTAEREAYGAAVALDWTGWRLLSLPLSAFQRRGDPVGWQSIDELRLTVEGTPGPTAATRLCLDDMWLGTLQSAEGAGPVTAVSGPGQPVSSSAPTIATPPGGEPPKGPGASPPERLIAEALEAKRKGDLELAFTKYIAVLLQDPRSVEAHWGLAWVLAVKGEKGAAIEHFQQVIELSADGTRVRDAKAALARLKGRAKG